MTNRGEKLAIVDDELNQRIIERIEAAKAAGELDAEQEEKLYRDLAKDYPILTSPMSTYLLAFMITTRYQRGQTLCLPTCFRQELAAAGVVSTIKQGSEKLFRKTSSARFSKPCKIHGLNYATLRAVGSSSFLR